MLPWTGFPVHHQLQELAQTHVHRVGDAIRPSHPVVPFSSYPQSFPTSGSFPVNQFFEIRWPRCWRFSFSISSSNEYSGLIYFRNVRFDLIAVEGTLKSLLQHHRSKASNLWSSAFFIIQLSHPYMTTVSPYPTPNEFISLMHHTSYITGWLYLILLCSSHWKFSESICWFRQYLLKVSP